jgi:N utilization substance protein A
MVTNELRGEKVDIVPFSDEPREFVMRALQPAKVKEVHLDDLTGTATVVVHDFQLSLAIGKEGQNARLAARLTGWRIDIKSETQIAEEEAYANQEWAEGEWVENEAGEMVWQPAEGGEAVSAEQWSLGETAETVETPEAGDAAETVETAEAGDAAGTAEAVGTADAAGTAEAVGTAEDVGTAGTAEDVAAPEGPGERPAGGEGEP